MFATLFSESPLDLGFIVSSLAQNWISLFTSNEELVRVSFSIVADAGSTVDLTVLSGGVLENELVHGST